MRTLLIKLLMSWLRKLGYQSFMHCIPEHVLAAARQATAEAERKGGAKNGEGKRAQALRMMMNLTPEANHREIALAIELCLPQ